MKHYFVDTNVIIDMLADREGYADAIITRNVKDFKHSKLPVIEPKTYKAD